MDPNENLRRQLELAQRIWDDESEDGDAHAADELAELVIALNDWITKGGFLPVPWNHTADNQHMIAFHGDKAIKSKYLARVEAHRKADELIRGAGWQMLDGKWRGCAIGCTLDAYDHARYPIELGIPQELARLEDRLFEGMPKEKAMKWPAEFLRAIPIGADLSGVWPKFAVWLLKDARKHARPDGKAAIDEICALYREGAPRGDARWAKARSAAASAADAADAAAYAADAAYAAAYAAADAAADASAYAAADAAADAAAYAAASAADAAAYAADAADAAAAARSGHYYRQSRRLLELLRRAPVKRGSP